MPKYNQEDGCEGESSEVQRGLMIDTFEEQFGDSYDSGQGAWSELSKEVAAELSRSVFAIASFKGDMMVCACSGIVIRRDPVVTTVLTSASLVRSSHDPNRIEDGLEIKVRLKYQQYSAGLLGKYDLDYNILLVNVYTSLVPVARLDHQVELESCIKVLAVGRIFSSRKLMATSGLVKDTFDQEEMAISTCKITKPGIGGPLVDFNGNFYGMNFYGEEETPFLPRSIVLKRLTELGIFRHDENKGGDLTRKRRISCRNTIENASSSYSLFPKEFVDKMHAALLSRGYPLPTTICIGLQMVNSFEERFCGLGGSRQEFFKQLNVELASKLSQSVVSLASFNGKTRWFACSGIFVEFNLRTSVLTSASLVRSSDDENVIDHNLQIEVRLPNGQSVKGTLQYCDLQYNIAVVDTIVLPEFRAENLYHSMQIQTGSEVVAVGRVFTNGKLTAARGVITDKKSNLNCDKLMISTCGITKAGIGGPLVDFSGNFFGMNFYDVEETPFLPRNVVLERLNKSDTRGIMTAETVVEPGPSPSRWPVPKSYWVYPSHNGPTERLKELESIQPLFSICRGVAHCDN
ncbi:hypothetical protein ACP4OV_023957 [Aristida adscensionis]